MNVDVAAALSHSIPSLKNDVNIALLDMNLDTIEVLGDSMIKMMEQSVQPTLGTNIDIRI